MTQTTPATQAFLAREAMALVAPDVLLRPLSGSRLHVSSCYHLERDQTELVVASDEDLASWQVCSWCQAELDGAGRHYFDDLERALESYAPLPVRTRIRELAAGVTHDAVWTTNSRSYVALGLDGASVAYFGKTYWVHEQVLDELPGSVPERALVTLGSVIALRAVVGAASGAAATMDRWTRRRWTPRPTRLSSRCSG